MLKKRIVFIHHAMGLGGAPISMVKIIKSLNKEKYHCTVFLLKKSDLCKYLEDNDIDYIVCDNFFYRKIYRFFPHIVPHFFKFHELHKIFIFGFLWLMSRYIFSKKIIKKIDADIIHLNSVVLTDFLKAASSRSKTVLHVREPLEKGYFGIRRKIFTSQIKKYANKIIAISHDNSKRLEIKKKVDVIYNFNEIKDFKEKKLTKKVLYVGGANTAKGFGLMVDALKYLNKDLKVIFCGSYDVPNLKIFDKIFKTRKYNIYKKILELNSYSNVEVIGMTSHIDKYYLETDMLINPFVEPHFSRPIIESFSHSNSVICTNIDGMCELVIDGFNGILLKENTPECLAKTINQTYSDVSTLKEMGENGFKFAKKIFSEKNVTEIEEIYEDLF